VLDNVLHPAAPARRTGAPGDGQGAWPPVLAVAFGAFAICTETFLVAGVLGGLATELGVTVGTAGSTVAVSALASAAGGPLLGAALGARPVRQVLIGALALSGLFTALSAAAPTFALLAASRALSALAASVYVPAAGAAAIAAAPSRSGGRALGVVLGGASVAMVLGAPLGVLLAATLSWRAAFGMAAVLAAAGVGLLLWTDVGSGRLGASTLAERLHPIRRPAVVGALGVTFLLMTASNSVFSYLAVLVGASAGLVGPGLVIGAFGLGGVVGAWWGGTAVDRRGDRRVVLLAGSGLTAAFALLPLVASTVGPLLAVVIGWGIAAWSFTAAQQRRLLGLSSGSAPMPLALNSAATHLGFAAGALLGGLVVDTAGAGSLWMLAVACCGVGLALHEILTRKV
jgi:predicted MFS family arabinose efflux permease